MSPQDLIAHDSYLRVELISATPNPQQTAWAAMRQDYCENAVADFRDRWPSEQLAGEFVINHCLSGGRGHFGVLEHPRIVLNVIGFNHTTMQQLRTHRHLSFDVQSGRYTGQRVMDLVERKRTVEEVFYLRPVGEYRDRQGRRYQYTDSDRAMDLADCEKAAANYSKKIVHGYSEEHAREMLPYAIRQHWVFSGNLRSLQHLADLRLKADAQLECQAAVWLIWEKVCDWAPQLSRWYEENRLKKARLAP